MRELCVLCHKVHEAHNWKYTEYETVDGVKYGYFCEKWFKPSHPEWVPQRIKDERNAMAKSMIQPYREGVLSKEFVDTYGTKHVDPKEVKKAKNVWKDTLPSNWQSTK
jgi:hypothetical protein